MLLPCNCCGYLIFDEDEYYEICPVCYWERGWGETKIPDGCVATNSITLREAQRNYSLFGAISEGYDLDFTGERPKEYGLDRDPHWRPLHPLGLPLPFTSRSMCRCCGYQTICVSHERCEICAWEFSPQQQTPDEKWGPNLFTLRESQDNFRKIGVKDSVFLGRLRRPGASDVRHSEYIKYDPPLTPTDRVKRSFEQLKCESILLPCACCGYFGVSGRYSTCRFCRWKFSPQQEQPDDPIGPNFISLRTAQRNFAEFGACKREELKNVVKPAADIPRL